MFQFVFFCRKVEAHVELVINVWNFTVLIDETDKDLRPNVLKDK